MKYSKFLVSTLVAAAAMTAPAFGDGDANTILINFDSANGTGASSISGTWNDTTDKSGSFDSLVFSDGSSGAGSVTWTSANTWAYTTDVTDGMLKGYLDDTRNELSIEFTSGNFLITDVTIYCATDTSSAFTAKSVNGTYYTYADGIGTIMGTGNWGASRTASIAEGTNALTISGILSSNLSISSNSGQAARGCIAGVKIELYTGTKTAVSLSGSEQTWTDSAIGSADWTNSTADAGTYAAFDLSADTSVNVTGTAITTDAITASGAGTLTLSGGAISLIGPGVVRTDSDSAAIVVNNSLTFASGGTISGNVSFGENSSITVSSGTLDMASVSSLPTAVSISLAESSVLNIGDVGDATVNNPASVVADYSGVQGKGTVSFNGANSNHSSGIVLGSGFTGTVVVSGKANLPRNSELGGATKVVLDNAYLWTEETKTYAQDFEITGTHTNAGDVGDSKQRGSGNITYTGTVTLKSGSSFGFEQGTTTFDGEFIGETGSTLNLGYSGATTTFNGTATLDAVNVSGGATTFNGTTDITTLNFSGGSLNFGTDAAVTVGNFTVTAGTLTLSGKVNVSGTLSAQNNGTSFTIASGSVVSAEKFYGSAGADTYSMTTTINGVFNVSGSTNDASPNFAAFLMANAGGRNTITVGDGGVLNLANAGVSNRDGTGVLNIASGGEANFGKGLYVLTNNETWGAATVNLTGGRLNVGADASGVGISTDGKSNVSVNLTTGTVGALSDSWSSALAFSLGGDVVFDTAKKQISTDGNATDTGTAAAIVLSGVLSDASDVSGKIVKDGAGTLTLSGANTFTGGVEISAGTLTAGNGNALGTGTTKLSGGQLSIASGVTLNLSALTIALGDAYADAAAIVGDGSLTLADAATITLTKADEVAIAFSVDEATKSYQIFDSSLAGDFSTDSFSLGEGWEGWQISSYDSSTGVLTLSIPEPSAFGLLAGAGALALVASRRRRRSRAK